MVNQIEDGEQTAMVGQRRCARLRVQPNPSRTEAFRGLETDRDQERYLDTVEVWRSSRHGPTTVFKGLPLPDATSHHRSFGYDGRTKPASASPPLIQDRTCRAAELRPAFLCYPIACRFDPDQPKQELGDLFTMTGDTLHYAGFWPRLGSLLLDLTFVLPLTALVFWASRHYRLFQVYYMIPGTPFGLFYNVYLVRRFGGTPGKLVVGIRIRKLDGEPVGYREAFLRNLPEFILALLSNIAFIFPLLHMSDAEYQSLSFVEFSKHITELAPSWYKPVQISQTIWFWGELIVLLTNRKRRALHDFIAGTVVVHASQNQTRWVSA